MSEFITEWPDAIPPRKFNKNVQYKFNGEYYAIYIPAWDMHVAFNSKPTLDAVDAAMNNLASQRFCDEYSFEDYSKMLRYQDEALLAKNARIRKFIGAR